ncbi:hypothetical protein KAFR_0A05530 [Kazachstania africana CBS 2517]|uniref:DUF1746 domain-containing protein n=1 Tax=Kazachstania africana (strain ATCC 22294 / BCRC 22015 / CBS 2517 / CECT 1963 / NBRC 1671 / NRRL Y-8276) TaxID=1071382 RepID=H2ANN8_KAZAF|nr:hypothetical protein KAFR_0A05530 [Kazachstania africana CBS 2517]CCF55988.1 hypothetical protein KAFR_0A05530 [Kazachstania africana CBS 2517]
MEQDNGTFLESRGKVYKLRKRNFQRNLITNLSLLGYLLIVLQYIKYGTTAWTLLIRCIFQSLLATPFPPEEQIRRIAASRNRADASNPERAPNNEQVTNISMPGGFSSLLEDNGTTNDDITQASRYKDLVDIKLKIRTLLFHGSLSFNVFLLLIAILSPVDFVAKFEDPRSDANGINNTPSPFANSNGLINGERRGGIFFQLIGESLPESNFWGNFGLFIYDFAILITQFTLFVLTCVNYAELGFVEPVDVQMSKSDGYDGNVFVAEINYNEAFRAVLQDDVDVVVERMESI